MNRTLMAVFNLTLLYLIFGTVHAFSQKTAVSNMSQNIVYLDIENELHIIQESTPCHSLKVTTDNGIIKNISPCKYLYIPATIGLSQIIVKGPKSEYNYLLRVEKKENLLEAHIGLCAPGNVKKDILLEQQALMIKAKGLTTLQPFSVLSFSVMILRENKIIKNFVCKSAMLSKELVDELKKTMNNDHLLVYNIIIEDENGLSKFLQPSEFIIH